MADLNPADDDQTTEVGLPHLKSKRRSSILKTRQPLCDLGSCDNDTTEHVPNKKSRRVSFSNKPEVREIPKINYREPVLDREAEATAQQSVDPSSALATDGANRSDIMASIQSLLLPPKMFNNQFGVYQLTDESDFKTLVNTNQNKVVMTCRASLMGDKTEVFANDTIEMTSCHGNISLQLPSAEEGLTRMEMESDVGSKGRKADCTLTQSFNKTKVFGDVSMEMTRCYDGLEGSFMEESRFDQTMLAGRSDEDLELDNDDEGMASVDASGRYAMDDGNSVGCRLNSDGVSDIPTSTSMRLIDVNSFLSALEFGHGLATNNAVEDGEMSFRLKSDARRTAKDSLRTAQIASTGGQSMDEEMSMNSGLTSTSLGLLQERELEQGQNINRTLLLGDDEGDMEMTVCLSKTITGGERTFNRTIILGEDEAGMEMTPHLSKPIKDGERISSRTVLLGEDDSEMEMTRCFSKTIKVGGRSFNETLILEEDQSGMGGTDSLLQDDGKNFISTKQSGERGGGLGVTKCVSNTCKESDTNRTVFLSDSQDKMEMTDCITKTMKLNATVLPPHYTNTKHPMEFGAGVNRTTAFGDQSRDEMSLTECLGKIANNHETFLSQKNVDRTKIFTVEGNGEDIEQTECVRNNVLQNATQTYSNWDLMETKVFSESAVDALDADSFLTSGKVKQSSPSQEVSEGKPLLDVNAFLSVFDCKGISQLSRQIGETVHILDQKKGTVHDAEVTSEAAVPAVIDALSTGGPKAHLCRTPVVNSGTMMKAGNNTTAPEFGMTALSARRTGLVMNQPSVMYTESSVAVVTEAAPFTGLDSSSYATHSSLAQDLSLASRSRATNRLQSQCDAQIGEEVHPEMVIAPETPVPSSVPGIVSAGLTADAVLPHPGNHNVNSLSNVTDLPWYINPRMESMEEEDMDVDVTVNLTQVVSNLNRSKNRSANEHITSVLQEDKSRSLPVIRVDCPENSTLLTRNSSSADDRWKYRTSLHTSENLSDVDKSVSDRVFDELRDSKDRNLDMSRGDHHERNSLRTGISSQPDDRLTYGTNDIKKSISKSLSEQALVEMHTDRSRLVSLDQVDYLGKFMSTGERSSNVADLWKLGVSLPVAANKSFAFEGKGKRKRCVDVSEEFFEKEPKRIGVSDVDGKDGGTFGVGADSVEAVLKAGQYRECTNKARTVAQEMSSSVYIDVSDGRDFPAVTPSVNSNAKREPENMAYVPVVTDVGDVTEQENDEEIASADVIDVEPSQTNLENANEVESSQTHLGSANDVEPKPTNLGSANDIEPNLGSASDVEPNQINLGSANCDADPCVLLPKDPTQMEIDEVTDRQVAVPDIVRDPQKTEVSRTLQSQDKSDLSSSVVIVKCLSERPENLEKRSSTQNSVQGRLTALKRPGVAVEEVIVFASEELRKIDEEVKQILRVKDELMKSLIVSLTEARNQIPRINATDKFSIWDLLEWRSSGCSFSFLCETLVLDVCFGSEVTGAMFCGRPAQEIHSLTIKSYPGKNILPECDLAHRLICELFDESVLSLYRDTSQLDKVLHHVLMWILKADRVKKDISDLDPLHIRCRVEIEGHRVTVGYLSAKARVAFTVACDVHLPQQLDTCPEWTVTCDFGHIREEEVLDQIRQLKPGFNYLGDVYRRIQTWLDTLKP